MSQSAGVSRPKPWEQKNGVESLGTDASFTENSSALQPSGNQPDLPSKPNGLNEGMDSLNGETLFEMVCLDMVRRMVEV